MEGFSTPDQRSERIVLEANLRYSDPTRPARLRRIIIDNTLAQHEAVELVKSTEGEVDLVTGLSPLDTLRVAQSPFAQVVKSRGALTSVFGMFNMRKTGSPWQDIRLRQAGYPQGLAINLITPTTREVQATVASKMLEQVGFQVTSRILDPVAFNRQTTLSHLEQPLEHQSWDIARPPTMRISGSRSARTMPSIRYSTRFHLSQTRSSSPC